MDVETAAARARLLAGGLRLERVTLGWNIAGVVIVAVAAARAHSVALVAFGLDSVIEIGASTVVLWELADTSKARQQRALRLIGFAFAGLSICIAVQATIVLAIGYHSHRSGLGIAWPATTSAVMFALAAGKTRAGDALENPVLRTEGRVTCIDGLLAASVLVGLALNAALGAWWADPLAGLIIVYYGARLARFRVGVSGLSVTRYADERNRSARGPSAPSPSPGRR